MGGNAVVMFAFSFLPAWRSPFVLFTREVCLCLWACSLGCQPTLLSPGLIMRESTRTWLPGLWETLHGNSLLGELSPGLYRVAVLLHLCQHWVCTRTAKLSQTPSFPPGSSPWGKGSLKACSLIAGAPSTLWVFCLRGSYQFFLGSIKASRREGETWNWWWKMRGVVQDIYC